MTRLPYCRRLVSLCLSAALSLASLGPGAVDAVAANIHSSAGKTLPGTPQVAPIPGGSILASPSGGSSAIGTPISLSGTVPSLDIPVLQAAPEASQSLTPGPALGLPEPLVPVVGTPAPLPAAKTSESRFGRETEGRSGISVGSINTISRDAVEAPKAVAESAAGSKAWAQDSFSYLKGEAASFQVSAAPADGESGGRARPASLGLAKPDDRQARSRWHLIGKAVTVVGAGATLGALSFPSWSHPSPGPLVDQAALETSGALHLLGQVGYVVGNFIGAIFSLPQVHKTFQDGHAKGTPMWRAAVLAAANLALGLVNATVAGKWIWGVQNLFAAVTILAVIPIGAYMAKRGLSLARAGEEDAAGRHASVWSRIRSLAGDKAMLATLAVAAAGFGLSLGAYFAAAAAIPHLLTGLLGAAGVAKLTLWVQAVTGGMYFLLFVPDILSILRGKAPKGFTPGFSLSFFIASLGFVLWTGQMAMQSPEGSSQRQQFLIYLGLNIAYAVVSLASWLIARKEYKKRH